MTQPSNRGNNPGDNRGGQGGGRFDNRAGYGGGRNQGGGAGNQGGESPSSKFIRQDMEKLVAKAREIAVNLVNNNVQTNQLRNFYEAVVQLGIELEEKRPKRRIGSPDSLIDRAKLLPTKLIWAAAKQDGDRGRAALSNFYEYVRVSVEGEGIFENGELNVDIYERFQQFVEAVIIYHKAKSSRVIQD